MDKEKLPFTYLDRIMLERSLTLKTIDDFEIELINNLRYRFRKYGHKMVITVKQRSFLFRLNEVFKSVWSV